jgi:carbon storage regulator
MLVLSRKLGEKLAIGDGIVLTVVRIEGNQVRLGIEAAGEVPILRGELTDPFVEYFTTEGHPVVAEACVGA